MSNEVMERGEAIIFLESLLGKILHITVVDGRLFIGTFKCTDNESNIILANSFEYRMPTKAAEEKAIMEAAATGQPAKADMTSRFVGLIVVPGYQIVKIELEEAKGVVNAQATSSATVSTPALSIRTK